MEQVVSGADTAADSPAGSEVDFAADILADLLVDSAVDLTAAIVITTTAGVVATLWISRTVTAARLRRTITIIIPAPRHARTIHRRQRFTVRRGQ